MAKSKTDSKEKEQKDIKKQCGIIMPIAPTTGYPSDHWEDVYSILTEAISQTEFEPSLVSDDPAIGLIHERIINNIYYNEIVVCDVSSKNPNVMFELGLRLAFDKPTIIVKDDKTDYSFDTGVIEHITYPSSLRFKEIVKFKAELVKRIVSTFSKSEEDTSYSPFLKSFGKNIVAGKINPTDVQLSEFVVNELKMIRSEINGIYAKSRDIETIKRDSPSHRNIETDHSSINRSKEIHIAENYIRKNQINFNDEEQRNSFIRYMINKGFAPSKDDIRLYDILYGYRK